MIFLSIHHVLEAFPLAIISGRGGRNQHDPFYLEFLAAARERHARYQTLRRHAEKRSVQLELVTWVEEHGGVFIKRNQNGTFQVMTHAEILEKISKLLYVQPSRRQVNVSAPNSVLLDTHTGEVVVVAHHNDATAKTGRHSSNTNPHYKNSDPPRPMNVADARLLPEETITEVVDHNTLDLFSLRSLPTILEDDDNESLVSWNSLLTLEMLPYDDDDDMVFLSSVEV